FEDEAKHLLQVVHSHAAPGAQLSVPLEDLTSLWVWPPAARGVEHVVGPLGGIGWPDALEELSIGESVPLVEALPPGGDLGLDTHPCLELALEDPGSLDALEDLAVGTDEQVDRMEPPSLPALQDPVGSIGRAGGLGIGPLDRGRSATVERDPEGQG